MQLPVSQAHRRTLRIILFPCYCSTHVENTTRSPTQTTTNSVTLMEDTTQARNTPTRSNDVKQGPSINTAMSVVHRRLSNQTTSTSLVLSWSSLSISFHSDYFTQDHSQSSIEVALAGYNYNYDAVLDQQFFSQLVTHLCNVNVSYSIVITISTY